MLKSRYQRILFMTSFRQRHVSIVWCLWYNISTVTYIVDVCFLAPIKHMMDPKHTGLQHFHDIRIYECLILSPWNTLSTTYLWSFKLYVLKFNLPLCCIPANIVHILSGGSIWLLNCCWHRKTSVQNLIVSKCTANKHIYKK